MTFRTRNHRNCQKQTKGKSGDYPFLHLLSNASPWEAARQTASTAGTGVVCQVVSSLWTQIGSAWSSTTDKLLLSSGWQCWSSQSCYRNAPKHIVTYNSHYIIAIMRVSCPSERQRTGSITNVRIPPKSIVYSLYKVEMSRARNGANLSIFLFT